MMTTTMHNAISTERVETLIETYGGNTDCWPDSERTAAMQLLEASSRLQQLLRDAQQLDEALLAGHIEEQPDEALLARIVDNLPPQHMTGQKVSSQGWLQRWPAGIAAGIAVMAITFAVMNVSQHETQPDRIVLQELDFWLWEEVTDQASYESNDEAPTDFMSIL